MREAPQRDYMALLKELNNIKKKEINSNMKKLLTIILASIIALTPLTLTGCSFMDAAVDTTILIEQNTALKADKEALLEENKALKTELANLKFELAFPNGLVTKSCILNNISIARDTVNLQSSVYAIKASGADVIVTINSGSYDAGQGSASNVAIWAHDGATVIINDGIFYNGSDMNGEESPVIYAQNGSIEINGGLFYSKSATAQQLINCNNAGGSIIIKGGSFIDFNPADVHTDDASSYIAEGYHVECEVINEGTEEEYRLYTVVEGEPEIIPEEPETPDEF